MIGSRKLPLAFVFIMQFLKDWLIFLESLILFLFLNEVNGDDQWRLNLISMFKIVIELFLRKDFEALNNQTEREKWIFGLYFLFNLFEYSNNSLFINHVFCGVILSEWE